MSTHTYTRLFILPSAPTVDEDETEGYEVGDVVIYAGAVYDCTDNATGAAVWQERSTGGAAVWGAITGTLSSQTDLQTALDAHRVGPQINAASAMASGESHDNDKFVVLRNGNTVTIHSVTETVLADIMAGYLDGQLAPGTHSHSAPDVPFTPTGGLSSTEVASALAELDTEKAPASQGVTNGNSHDHSGGDGAQIDHGGLAGLSDDDHTQYVKHSLATATSDFLVGTVGAWVKKTLAETITILRTSLDSIYAAAANGVTGGDSHDHNGGDGAQIAYSSLSGALTLAAGTWNPSGVAVANVDAITDFTAQYFRVGNLVHCCGQIGIDPTAAGATTRVRIDLPIASAFTAASQCIGAVSDGAGGEGLVRADATNAEAELLFVSAVATNRNFSYIFTYQVI